jgi:hypothetical protein
MPVPQTSDLLATISMFEQIKAEPMGFYSACPPPTAQMVGVQAPLPPRSENSQQSVITSNDDKDNTMQAQSLIVVSRRL